MLFEASNRKLGFTGLLTLAFGLAFSADANADGPMVTTEHGQPGSGVKVVTRYHSHFGFGPTAHYVETSRHTVYDDGRDEWRYFSDDGRLVRQETRYPDGHSELVLNVEGGLKPRLALSVDDEVYFVTDAPAPATHAVSVGMSKSGFLTVSNVTLSGLPAGFKQIAGYKAHTTGSVKVSVSTTVAAPSTNLLSHAPRQITSTQDVKITVR